MTSTDPFALQRSGMNEFLCAEIGTEPNGMPLSLLSALSRLGKDPWQEARRLAELPRNLAVSGLAALIETSSAQPVTEATTIAQRLVTLLPGNSRKPAARPAAPSAPKAENIVQYAAALVAILLTAAVLLSAGSERRMPPSDPLLERTTSVAPVRSAEPSGVAPVPASR